MWFPSILVGVGALAVGAVASSRTITSASITSSAASKTTSSAATTHTIAVGANGFKFEPAQTNASVGDVIEWRFYPTGHWVVRAAFGQPCIPYEDTGPNLVGFSSGLETVATTSDNGPRFRVKVNDTAPIFFYCAGSGSCVNYHMVGVINPSANETYEEQYEYAENATYQMTPGEAFPSETAGSTASAATATSGASSSSGSSSDDHKSLSAGAIAGIAIGAAALIVLAAALVYLFGRRSGKNRATGGPDPYAEPRWAGPNGPKSPGQETFTTAGYSTAPSADPSQMQKYGGMAHGAGYPASTVTPPPMSEYSQSLYHHQQQQQLHHYGSVPQGLGGSPALGADPHGAMQTGAFTATQKPPQQNAPVELPTSLNPGESPLPQYNRNPDSFSWTQAGEGTYRPSQPL